MSLAFFYLFAALAVVSAILVISFRNTLSSAFSLVAALFAVACLFAMTGAHFLAAMQVLVYAGAIMVLFLFVIMLLNLGREELLKVRMSFPAVVGILSGGYLAALLVFRLGFLSSPFPKGDSPKASSSDYGSLREVGRLLFSDYLVPFEMVSVLLLVAIIGAVVLGKPSPGPSTSSGPPSPLPAGGHGARGEGKI